jgi:hypothetical protein
MTSEPKLSFEELVEREAQKYALQRKGNAEQVRLTGFRQGVQWTLDNLDKVYSVKNIIINVKTAILYLESTGIEKPENEHEPEYQMLNCFRDAIAEFERK